jgi:hypothetical protein
VVDNKREAEICEEKARIYLYEKYNQEFIIELKNKGYRSKFGGFLTYVEYGKDRSTKEYVYTVTDSERKIKSYITVWRFLKENRYTVSEVDGEASERVFTSYEARRDKYDIYTKVEQILKDNIKYYSFSNNLDEYLEGDFYSIEVKINANYSDILENHFEVIQEIRDIDKDYYDKYLMDIKIQLKDATRWIKSNEESMEKDRELINSIENYLSNNYKIKYTILFEEKVEKNINIYLDYNEPEKDKELNEFINELAKEYDKYHFCIKYNDDIDE